MSQNVFVERPNADHNQFRIYDRFGHLLPWSSTVVEHEKRGPYHLFTHDENGKYTYSLVDDQGNTMPGASRQKYVDVYVKGQATGCYDAGQNENNFSIYNADGKILPGGENVTDCRLNKDGSYSIIKNGQRIDYPKGSIKPKAEQKSRMNMIYKFGGLMLLGGLAYVMHGSMTNGNEPLQDSAHDVPSNDALDATLQTVVRAKDQHILFFNTDKDPSTVEYEGVIKDSDLKEPIWQSGEKRKIDTWQKSGVTMWQIQNSNAENTHTE